MLDFAETIAQGRNVSQLRTKQAGGGRFLGYGVMCTVAKNSKMVHFAPEELLSGDVRVMRQRVKPQCTTNFDTHLARKDSSATCTVATYRLQDGYAYTLAYKLKIIFLVVCA